MNEAEAAGADMRRFSASARRNLEPILGVLAVAVPAKSQDILEVASGSGFHATGIAQQFSISNVWPTDCDPDNLASLAAWRAATPVSNLRPGVVLDVTSEVWCNGDAIAGVPAYFDAIVCINMIHIAPWRACEGLLAGAGQRLHENGVVYLYGPFARGGGFSADSNRIFDEHLRAQNREWGVRDLDDVVAAANRAGLVLDGVTEMPANNLSVVFRLQ